MLHAADAPVQECDVAGEAVEVLQEAPYSRVAPRIAVLQVCRRYQHQLCSSSRQTLCWLISVRHADLAHCHSCVRVIQ